MSHFLYCTALPLVLHTWQSSRSHCRGLNGSDFWSNCLNCNISFLNYFNLFNLFKHDHFTDLLSYKKCVERVRDTWCPVILEKFRQSWTNLHLWHFFTGMHLHLFSPSFRPPPPPYNVGQMYTLFLQSFNIVLVGGGEGGESNASWNA